MKNFIEKAKINKRYTIFVLVLMLITLSATVAFTVVESIKRQRLSRNFDLIEREVENTIDYAHLMNQDNVSFIEEEVEQEYGYNMDRLEEDLKTINEINTLTKILRSSIENDFIYGMDSSPQADNNDPFFMDESKILVDLSTNCSTEMGNSRTLSKEIEGQFNPTLATKAINGIIDGTSYYYIWHYLPVDKSLPYYSDIKQLEYVDIEVLRNLYYKYDGDYRVLKGFEFLVPEYIYRNKDLAGNPTVNSIGHAVPNYQLILVQGFNIIDVLDNQDKMKGIKEDYRYLQRLSMYIYSAFLILSLIWLIAFTLFYHLRKE